MDIYHTFYIRVSEEGNRIPMMEFFPPKYSMLTHLGFANFSKSQNLIEIILNIEEAIINNNEYTFASDDWCIVTVNGSQSIVSNGFGEFMSFVIESSYIYKLLSDWMIFLKKYEEKKIPGLL